MRLFLKMEMTGIEPVSKKYFYYRSTGLAQFI